MSTEFRTKSSQGGVIPLESQTLELGNSDRIRLKFGSYGIEVVESGERIRVSKLYSIKNGVKTNRTFAVVLYPLVISVAFEKEHEEILNGQSIGIVFKNNGWVIKKRHQYFGKVEWPLVQTGLNSIFGDTGIKQPVIHVYSLCIKKQNTEYHYASIAEVHHPAYLDFDDIKAIYGKNIEFGRSPGGQLAELLDILQSRMLKS